MNTKKVILKTVLSVAIMLSAAAIYAQPSGGGGGVGSGGTPPPGAGAPIDGGAGILLAGIATYAHRKLKSKDEAK